MTTAGPGFFGVEIDDSSEPSLTFRSHLTVYTERFRRGQLLSRGWNGAGFAAPEALEFEAAQSGEGAAFALTLDGQDLATHWSLAGIEQEDDGDHLLVTVRLTHTVRPVALAVRTRLDGTAVMTRWLDVTNNADRAVPLSAISPWRGVLWHTIANEEQAAIRGRAFEVGSMADPRACHEGAFDWTELGEGVHRIDGRRAVPGHRHPAFFVRSTDTGEHYMGQLAWSGGYALDVTRRTTPYGGLGDGPERVLFDAAIDAPAPQRVLAPGETVSSPAMHLGMVMGDLDLAVQQMHTHIRRSVRPRSTQPSGLVETLVWPMPQIDEADVLGSIEHAADLGVEVFALDAVWYYPNGSSWESAVGDWDVADKFPRGLAPFRERAHELGMRFGLWMEPERIGRDSRAWQSAHRLATRPDGTTADGDIALGDPDVAGWFEDTISSLISEHELDFLRLDFNTGFLGEGFVTAQDGFLESHYWRYYETLYAVFDRLRSRHPDVIFENCASGGGRTDLGMLGRFDHTWVTDWQIAPRSIEITDGMSLVLPPEMIDRYVGRMNGHARGSIDLQARLALFGRPTIARFEPANGPHHARVRHAVDLYKRVVRPFQDTCRTFHHTAGAPTSGWTVLEQAAADASTAILGFFRDAPGSDRAVAHPRGIDPGRTYRVTFDNAVLAGHGTPARALGADLVREGLAVTLGTPLTSELVLLEAEE